MALLAISGLWLLRRRWLVVTVRGVSMAPTLRDGERVIARRGRGIRRGDIVVFRVAARDGLAVRIKRVVGIAGDAVPARLRAGALVEDASVPAQHVVVAGDNPRSEDSRHLGFVPEVAIIGVVRRSFPEASPHG